MGLFPLVDAHCPSERRRGRLLPLDNLRKEDSVRPDMYVAERVAPREIHDGDVVLWRSTATCVLAEPLARIAKGGRRVDYDVKLNGITTQTITVPGTHTFWRLRPRWEIA
jgi:hypothetical protein